MQFFICLVLEKLIMPFCENCFAKTCFHESLGRIFVRIQDAPLAQRRIQNKKTKKQKNKKDGYIICCDFPYISWECVFPYFEIPGI